MQKSKGLYDLCCFKCEFYTIEMLGEKEIPYCNEKGEIKKINLNEIGKCKIMSKSKWEQFKPCCSLCKHFQKL